MSINTFLIQTNIFLIWFQEIHLEFENTHFLIWTNTFKNFEQILFSMWTNTFIKLNKYIAYSTQIRRELPLWARRGLRSPVHGGSEFLFLLLLARCWWWLARCPQFPGCCLHCWSTGQSSLIQLQQPSHMTYACYPNLDSEIIIRNTDTGRALQDRWWQVAENIRTKHELWRGWWWCPRCTRLWWRWWSSMLSTPPSPLSLPMPTHWPGRNVLQGKLYHHISCHHNRFPVFDVTCLLLNLSTWSYQERAMLAPPQSASSFSHYQSIICW